MSKELISPDDLVTPYKPTPIYYPDSDKFEFVEKDCMCVYQKAILGIDWILDVDGRSVIGFAIDGSLIRHMMREATASYSGRISAADPIPPDPRGPR